MPVCKVCMLVTVVFKTSVPPGRILSMTGPSPYRRCGIGWIRPQVLTVPAEGLHGGLLGSVSQLQMAPQHIHAIRRIRFRMRASKDLGDGQEFPTFYFFWLQDHLAI